MPFYLGIDTSNYTTSAALYDAESGVVCHRKQLLTVHPGERGLRQSDAVFLATIERIREKVLDLRGRVMEGKLG